MSNDAVKNALRSTLDRLEAQPIGGYAASDIAAAEPTAWAAIALAAGGRNAAAREAADWLRDRQQPDGSVGVTAEQTRPAWTTGPAVLAWEATDPAAYAGCIDRAIGWALEQEPWTAPRTSVFGHDTTLAGWSWAADTHSWLEPTAFFVKALHAAGRGEAPRADEGVRLLVDRLLPGGGANYGNTIVLGQELLQHVQSSGVVAWALADVAPQSLDATLDYLSVATNEPTGIASLCWAAMGLAANGRADERLTETLARAHPRVMATEGAYKRSLYAAAVQSLAAVRETAP